MSSNVGCVFRKISRGWEVVFTVLAQEGLVRIANYYRGMPAGAVCCSIDEARKQYTALTHQGYIGLGGNF